MIQNSGIISNVYDYSAKNNKGRGELYRAPERILMANVDMRWDRLTWLSTESVVVLTGQAKIMCTFAIPVPRRGIGKWWECSNYGPQAC